MKTQRRRLYDVREAECTLSQMLTPRLSRKGKGCGFISVLPTFYSESNMLLVFNKYLLNERHFLQVTLSYRIILYVVNLPNIC